MDKTSGMAIGYSVSNSTTIKPSVRYAFRSPSDSLGTIGTTEYIPTNRLVKLGHSDPSLKLSTCQ